MKTFTSLKRISTLFLSMILLLMVENVVAQDKGFVHTTNESNTYGHITVIDHPLLNNNPNARFLFSQRYVTGLNVDNNNPTGIWYDGARWNIYNENIAPMALNVSFNIYIPDDSEVNLHVANAGNTLSHITYLSGYTEGDFLFHNHYYNSHMVYNPNVYGHWFSDSSRTLYEESFNSVPENAAFFVMKGSGTSASLFSESSDITNINGNAMRIDHPSLNGNPNAVFLFSHYWGFPNPSNSVYLPGVSEAFYFDGYWYIFNYNGTFPENVWIDIIVPDEIMDVTDQDATLTKLVLYPNPVVDILSIESKSKVEEIQIYNVSGQLVFHSQQSGNKVQINISNLPSGIYMGKFKTEKGWIKNKIIKK